MAGYQKDWNRATQLSHVWKPSEDPLNDCRSNGFCSILFLLVGRGVHHEHRDLRVTGSEQTGSWMNLKGFGAVLLCFYSQVFLFCEIETKGFKKNRCKSVMDLGYYNFIQNSSVAIFANTQPPKKTNKTAFLTEVRVWKLIQILHGFKYKGKLLRLFHCCTDELIDVRILTDDFSLNLSL